MFLDYATIKVKYDPSGNQNILSQEGTDATKGQTNLFERSWDGRIVETYLHDGTKVCSYKEKSNDDAELYTHLVYSYDGSVMKIREDGEVVIISEKDRHDLAQVDPDAKEEDFAGKEWLKPNEKSYFS